MTVPTRRLRSCVQQWPDAYSGGHDPRCCRFPKSCSATVYDPDMFTPEELEPMPLTADRVADLFGVPAQLLHQGPTFPNPFADDPDTDRPMGSLWTVVACLVGAGLALGAAVAAFRRLERGRR